MLVQGPKGPSFILLYVYMTHLRVRMVPPFCRHRVRENVSGAYSTYNSKYDFLCMALAMRVKNKDKGE